MKTKKKETFGWRCGYEKIYGSFHGDNERCGKGCRKKFDTLDAAIKAGTRHTVHSGHVYVYSNKTGYIKKI